MSTSEGLDFLVLAAGIGSRYGGLKQMDPVGPHGEFILDYSVRDAVAAGFDRVVFVIRRDIEKDFRRIAGGKWENKVDVRYVFQDMSDLPEGFSVPEGRTKPWGTAHAVLAARNEVRGAFGVVNADDFYGAEAIASAAGFLRETASERSLFCMVAYDVAKTLSENGSVSRGVCRVSGDGYLLGISERAALQRLDDGLIHDVENGEVFPADTPVSMNLFGFKRSYIDFAWEHFPEFLRGAAGRVKAEYQMPTVLQSMLSSGAASLRVLRTDCEWFGVTRTEDRAGVVEKLKRLEK